MTNEHIVMVGAGQSISRWTAGEPNPPSPHSLRLEAARLALGDVRAVDVLAVVRTTEDSVPTSSYPNGRNANPPGTLARDLNLKVGHAIYHHVGGQSPQELVNELADRIYSGEIASALIVGAEAVSAAKTARRAGVILDWADDDPSAFEDRGAALDWVDMDELRHGLMTPANYYGLCETALMAERGQGREAHRRAMAELFAPFSRVASDNPFAQFPVARDAEFLANPSPENYPVSDPYLKWHVAQDAVNQGAAILLTSETLADELALTDRTYLRGGTDIADCALSRREVLHRSPAMDDAVARLLHATETKASAIDALDLYSCFPVAVWSALSALDLDADRTLTLTGGLPFFGGPGNNYPLHAIAEMHGRLSGNAQTGLVLANGGWMSKQSVGLYSGAPCDYVAVGPAGKIAPSVDLAGESIKGRLETFTVTRGRVMKPISGTAFVRLGDGRRALAVVTGEPLDRLMPDTAPIGASVRVDVRNGIGHLAFC